MLEMIQLRATGVSMKAKVSRVIQAGAPWLARFGVVPKDPGDIYVVCHSGRYKVGRSTNALVRIKEAKTWLPDVEVVGIKPFWNAHWVERCMHLGFSRCWYAGEWFELVDEGYRRTFLDGFRAFSDTDRDNNSVDFIYWFNGDGMAEFVREQHCQRLTAPKFLRQESLVSKSRNR